MASSTTLTIPTHASRSLHDDVGELRAVVAADGDISALGAAHRHDVVSGPGNDGELMASLAVFPTFQSSRVVKSLPQEADSPPRRGHFQCLPLTGRRWQLWRPGWGDWNDRMSVRTNSYAVATAACQCRFRHSARALDKGLRAGFRCPLMAGCCLMASGIRRAFHDPERSGAHSIPSGRPRD